jgi:hypothetical protein
MGDEGKEAQGVSPAPRSRHHHSDSSCYQYRTKVLAGALRSWSRCGCFSISTTRVSCPASTGRHCEPHSPLLPPQRLPVAGAVDKKLFSASLPYLQGLQGSAREVCNMVKHLDNTTPKRNEQAVAIALTMASRTPSSYTARARKGKPYIESMQASSRGGC